MPEPNRLLAPGMASINGTPWAQVKSRKRHHCAWCGRETEPGEEVYRPLRETHQLIRWYRLCVPCVEQSIQP